MAMSQKELNTRKPVVSPGLSRYSRQKNASVTADIEFDRFVWQELELLRKDREKATGIRWSIDHMYPLKGKTISGLHTASNWQLIPLWMNVQKSRRPWLCEQDEWLRCINKPVLLAFWGWREWRKLEIIREYEDGVYG